MKIETLYKKAHKAENEMNKYCGLIVIEILKGYKQTRDKYEESSFCEDLGCFIQAGDGLVLTDQYGSNVPVSYICDIIKNKGYFTFDDFKENRI